MAIFENIESVVERTCFMMNDNLLKKKMRLLKISVDVHEDMQLNVIKSPEREFFQINKRTWTVDLPCRIDELESVSFVDCYGIIHPVYRNERLHRDIVDVRASKNCECGCSSELCHLIKNYVGITEVVTVDTPEGGTESFTCITRKYVTPDGLYREQRQYPIRINDYTGDWIANELTQEDIQLCKLDVDHNGCIIDCSENLEKLNCVGCITSCRTVVPGNNGVGDSFIVGCGTPYDLYRAEAGSLFSRTDYYFNNIYNITDDGKRLIFPVGFPHNKVLLGFYKGIEISNIKVPIIARPAFMMGLAYFDTLLSADPADQKLNQIYDRKYTMMKFGMLQEFNKNTIAELRMTMTPPVVWPSIVHPYFNSTSWNIYNTQNRLT